MSSLSYTVEYPSSFQSIKEDQICSDRKRPSEQRDEENGGYNRGPRLILSTQERVDPLRNRETLN